MSETKRVLRDMPGVAELEARLIRIATFKSPMWAPEADGLDNDVERLSRDLFGFTAGETAFDDDAAEGLSDEAYDEAFDAWEAHFAVLGEEGPYFFLRDPPADSLATWAAMGWDASDGAGRELWATALLGRQMVVVAKGLRLTSRDLSEDEAGSIEERLRAEAAKFRRK